MRVGVTGAGGFTGRFVADALARRGATCVPLQADLRDPPAIRRAVKEAGCDRFVHLAARAFVGASEWEPFYTVNQLGTLHLLDAIAQAAPGARCVLASSGQVYGPGAEGLIAEDAPTDPANHYAISKLAMERGARLWRDALNIVVTRPFNYTGVGQGTQYLITKIIDHFRRKAEVIELGNLWVKRDFGDVRDVADAYAQLVLADASPDIVNIATGHVRSIDEIIDILAQLSGHRPKIHVNPAFVRANDVPVLGGDPGRLRAALSDWSPRDLADTLGWMYEGYSAIRDTSG